MACMMNRTHWYIGEKTKCGLQPFAHNVEAAILEAVVVATSGGAHYAACTRQYGSFLRPLAQQWVTHSIFVDHRLWNA